jgi:two-component system chemotaxis response regulator CheB
VVTLDLVMPHLDGLGVLRALPPTGAPRVVVVSASDAESEIGLLALESGAVDLVHKPTALATDRLYELSNELLHKVEIAAVARRVPSAASATATRFEGPACAGGGSDRVLVIGTSTGGPQALTRLLAELPGDLPCATAVVVHIPPGYTEALARRLDKLSALSVVEAREGLELSPGLVVVAQAGVHLRLKRYARQITAHLDFSPHNVPHRPSVDVLFESAAREFGAGVLGVVLTGMGNDGLAGARAIREAGGTILTEAESSCVIYGMPRCVREAGLAHAEAPLEGMAAEILRWV